MNNNKGSMHQNVVTSETLPEEYRNMKTWEDNQDGQVQLNQSASEYSQILQGSGINGAMSRIKRANLLKVDRQNFQYHRITAIKHQPSHSSGNFHHD